MNTKTFLVAGIVGGIVNWLLGWLFFGISFADIGVLRGKLNPNN
ncbi:hypothetical protein [Psychroserpens sp.]